MDWRTENWEEMDYVELGKRTRAHEPLETRHVDGVEVLVIHFHDGSETTVRDEDELRALDVR